MKTFKRTSLIGLVAFLIFSHPLTNLLTDWWWYQEIHNGVFFLRSLELKAIVFASVFLLIFVPSFISVSVAHRLAPLRIRILNGNILEYPEHLIHPYFFPLLQGFAGLIAMLYAFGAASNWALALPIFGRPLFPQVDPVFHHNLGFYVFYLPILEYAYQIGMTSIFLAVVLSVISYGIQRALRLSTGGFKMEPIVSTHLSILLGGAAIVKGFGYLIGRFGLLLSRQGSVFGIGYTDFHARIPLLTALSAIAFLTGFLFFINAKIHQWKPMIGAMLIWLLASAGLLFYPGAIQQLRVVPSELDKERPFLEKNIAMTRMAYQLDGIQERRIQPSPLTAQALQTQQPTLENIRLWDREPLKQSLGQLQEIRPYYTFMNVDVDRYTLDGKLREVMLATRELDYSRIQNPTWANEHLIFTHGYGFVATRVNQVTSEGLPTFLVKDIPPASAASDLHTDFPEIYYGESANPYVLVNSKQAEFNYPSGEENQNTHYQGTGGVPLSSWWRRSLFAYRFSGRIFFSTDLDSHSRILFNRGVSERLNQAFPLLIYDQDPYPVIVQKKMYWICDAYTVNDHMPYSNPVLFRGDSYNYIRNSVKVAVDAYNGNLTYYVADSADPIIQLYAKAFPGWFHPLSDMPFELRKHLRVPEDFFMAQASVYALYHMTDPNVFYNREDQWQIPRAGEEAEIRPYYVIMQIPGSAEPEFILMLPFTPNKKDNLAAWMAARSDEAHYGQELAFEFPKESLVYGPTQVAARINQDPKFSQLRTLLGQQGSRISVGHLQVIPVGDSILYVEPLYLRAEQKELPELKLVLLAYGDKIAIEDNLEKALASVFKDLQASSGEEQNATASPQAPLSAPKGTRLHEALLHYKKAMEYQKKGEWAKYGEEIRALGRILQK